MEDYIPYRGFRWVRNAVNFEIFANKEKKIGHILEVDVEIPTHLHEYFEDLPPLLTHEDFGSGPKLVGTLFPKKKYVIHIEMLRFIINLGVIVTKNPQSAQILSETYFKKIYATEY